MKKFKCEKLIITGDLNNYDDFITLYMTIINNHNVAAIIISRSGWSNPGASIRTVGNLLQVCDREDIKIFVGKQVDLTSDRLSHIVSSDEMIKIDLLYGGVYDLSNRKIDFSDDYERYVKELSIYNRIGVISLGPMTDVANIIKNVSWVIQQGAKIGPYVEVDSESQFQSFSRPKNGAASNLYLDPISAQICMKEGSEKITWILSGLFGSDITDKSFVDFLKDKYENADCQRGLKSIITFFQGMEKSNRKFPLSDLTALLVYMYPEKVIKKSEEMNLLIDDNITESITQDGDFFNWNYHISKQIGLMLPGPYKTTCVTEVNVEAIDKLVDKLL